MIYRGLNVNEEASIFREKNAGRHVTAPGRVEPIELGTCTVCGNPKPTGELDMLDGRLTCIDCAVDAGMDTLELFEQLDDIG